MIDSTISESVMHCMRYSDMKISKMRFYRICPRLAFISVALNRKQKSILVHATCGNTILSSNTSHILMTGKGSVTV